MRQSPSLSLIPLCVPSRNILDSTLQLQATGIGQKKATDCANKPHTNQYEIQKAAIVTICAKDTAISALLYLLFIPSPSQVEISSCFVTMSETLSPREAFCTNKTPTRRDSCCFAAPHIATECREIV